MIVDASDGDDRRASRKRAEGEKVRREKSARAKMDRVPTTKSASEERTRRSIATEEVTRA
jgi:hypothetical protein